MRDRQWVSRKVTAFRSRVRTRIAAQLDRHKQVAERILGQRTLQRLAYSESPGFASADRITVSIIIPVFNHCRDSFVCLKSISRFTNGPTYEVIVVDDGSTDETREVLERIPG